MATRRIAILGTAPSWKDAPFMDASWEKWALNDAYDLYGPILTKQCSRWVDIHPPDKFWFRPKNNKIVLASDVPPGHFVRPEGHVEWLQSCGMPLYVRPKGLTVGADGRLRVTDPAPIVDWPNAVAFPIVKVCELLRPLWFFDKDYLASTPVQMFALAMLEGATEIGVWGIHLASSTEYVYQRPNFEWLIGVFQGRGGKVYLPSGTSIMRASHIYGFEQPPVMSVEAVKQEMQVVNTKREVTLHQWQKVPVWKRVARRAAWKALKDSEREMARVQGKMNVATGIARGDLHPSAALMGF